MEIGNNFGKNKVVKIVLPKFKTYKASVIKTV